MSTQPETSPTPSQHSAWWTWTKRIGCTFVLVILGFVVSCCGVACGGVKWLDHWARSQNKDEIDRVHDLGMCGGDLQAMHDRAAPEFRIKVPLDELRRFVEARPGLLERDRLAGEFRRKVINGVEFVSVRNRDGIVFVNEWDIVFKVVDQALVFIGISPGLDEFVPEGFRFHKPSGRRHRFRWD